MSEISAIAFCDLTECVREIALAMKNQPTWRDQLAKAAMQGIVSSINSERETIVPELTAKFAYEIADAMIEEARKEKTDA